MQQTNKLELLKEAISPVSWDNGSYSFYSLTISLKGTATIEALKNEKENANCFVTLIHEYVHFIQNFTTTFGFTNFITYIDLFAVFFGENILLNHDPAIPIQKGIVDTKFGNKNFANFMKCAFLGIEKNGAGKFVFQPTSEKDFTIIESTIKNTYWSKDVPISYIAYQRKLIPLNEFVASENMAIVASYLSSGLSLDEAKKTISKWGIEYHIIYSFLNNIFPNKNCFKLTYIISEISLLIPPYTKIIADILMYLSSYIERFDKLNEDEIIGDIKKKVKFDIALPIILKETNNQLDERILTFTKYEKQYEFYIYLKEVLNLFKRGLAERATSSFTYRDNFDSSFLDYYGKIINSPILIFSDEKKTMLGELSDEFINSIAIFSGVLTVFLQTYFNKINKCPFVSNNSLCAHTKGNECLTNPFSIYVKEEYRGCLFYNSLNIIGLKKPGRV